MAEPGGWGVGGSVGSVEGVQQILGGRWQDGAQSDLNCPCLSGRMRYTDGEDNGLKTSKGF